MYIRTLNLPTAEIDAKFPLTKELIKDFFTYDYVKKYFADSFLIFEAFDFFNLKTSSKNLEFFERIRVKSFQEWTETETKKCSSIFIDAFLKDIDSLEIKEPILVQIANGIHYCFRNYADYRDKSILDVTFDSVLSDIQPTDLFGYAFGTKNTYCYVNYNHNSECEFTYYFSKSKEVVLDKAQESYIWERSLMSEGEWEIYFPDQDLDEVFGFSLDDIEKN